MEKYTHSENIYTLKEVVLYEPPIVKLSDTKNQKDEATILLQPPTAVTNLQPNCKENKDHYTLTKLKN